MAGENIRIKNGLLREVGALIREKRNPGKVALISDDNVMSLYGMDVLVSLEIAGFEALPYALPQGEGSKNLATYAGILAFLAEHRFTRSDLVVALGGGVVGDMAGFAAATFLRGIDVVQVPTTLLAEVDSSIGGKTGLDLPQGKNLVGAFHQPLLVLIDPAVVKDLPQEVYRDGVAEIIKYGCVGSKALFNTIRDTDVRDCVNYVINICANMKAQLAEADEFDRGDRRKLNFGHTFGHAIETLSGWAISHGEGVAIGMMMVTRAAVKRKYCQPELLEELEALLVRYGLPTECPYSAEKVAEQALADKKIVSGTLTLVVPEILGRTRFIPVQPEALADWAADGGAPRE